MKVKIVSARDRRELAPDGRSRIFAVYEFTLDGLGPFTYQTPAEEDTAEKLKAAINKKIEIIKTQG